MPRFEHHIGGVANNVGGFVGDICCVDLISGAGAGGGGVGQGWAAGGFYYLLAASDLISDAAAVAAGGARARGEAAAASAAAKAASDLLPPLPLCCRQHRKCLRWCRGRAMMPSITSASDGSGIGSDERRCRLHSAFVAAARGRRRLQQAAAESQQTTGSGICFGRSLS